jgi:DNA adenine methylase
VPYLRRWLKWLEPRPSLFVEPFAGGGIASLTAVAEGLAERAVMFERDPCVAAVWDQILDGEAANLARRIEDFPISRSRVEQTLSNPPHSREDLAFQTILRNRVNRGGIMAPGASMMRNGENGHGVASRWYPRTLAERIREIARMKDRLEFREGDAMRLLPRFLNTRRAAFFVDPPYTAGGKKAGNRLYAFNDLDHEKLFAVLNKAHSPVLMTYDGALEVERLAQRYGFHVGRIPMKNTHHALMDELVITKPAFIQVGCQELLF